MKEEQNWWAPPLGAAILIALLTSIALIAAGGWDWFVTFLGKEGSGWAQAIGSVLAIVGAYRMGRAQMTADRALEVSRRAHEDYRRLMVIDAALHRLETTLSTIKENMDRFEVPIFITVKWYQEQIRDAAKTIKSFNLFDCPSAPLIHMLSLLPSAAESFADTIGEYMKVCEEGMEKDVRRKLPGLWNGFTVAMGPVTMGREICKERMAALQVQL